MLRLPRHGVVAGKMGLAHNCENYNSLVISLLFCLVWNVIMNRWIVWLFMCKLPYNLTASSNLVPCHIVFETLIIIHKLS